MSLFSTIRAAEDRHGMALGMTKYGPHENLQPDQTLCCQQCGKKATQLTETLKLAC